MWYDKDDTRILAMDNRTEEIPLCDGRIHKVNPDVQGDYRKTPFPSDHFSVVLLDPPHLINAGEKSWLKAKYGKLDKTTWGADLKAAMQEAFRVLKQGGVLYFKWNTEQVPKSQVEALFPHKPVFITGHHKTYHYLFIKP